MITRKNRIDEYYCVSSFCMRKTETGNPKRLSQLKTLFSVYLTEAINYTCNKQPISKKQIVNNVSIELNAATNSFTYKIEFNNVLSENMKNEIFSYLWAKLATLKCEA